MQVLKFLPEEDIRIYRGKDGPYDVAYDVIEKSVIVIGEVQ